MNVDIISWLLDPTHGVVRVLTFIIVLIAVGHVLKAIHHFWEGTPQTSERVVQYLEILFLLFTLYVLSHWFLRKELVDGGHLQDAVVTIGVCFIFMFLSGATLVLFSRMLR